MATVPDPRNPEFKVTPMQQVNPRQQVNPMQKVHLMQPPIPTQPVILMPLNPPEKDYLFLSIIAFFFFIPLAIPALLFSLKTREANFLGDQRKAKISSRLVLGFSISSILLGTLLVICTVVIRVLKQEM
uniref:Uncharacterized protein n=1 Tax=Equus asinus TaxID=9793 RepID=A0A9L0IYK0_EQUAS